MRIAQEMIVHNLNNREKMKSQAHLQDHLVGSSGGFGVVDVVEGSGFRRPVGDFGVPP